MSLFYDSINLSPLFQRKTEVPANGRLDSNAAEREESAVPSLPDPLPQQTMNESADLEKNWRQILTTQRRADQNQAFVHEQLRAAASAVYRLEADLRAVDADLRGAIFEVMRRVGRLMAFSSGQSSRTLAATNGRRLAVHYFFKWRAWSRIKASLRAIAREAMKQFVKRFFSRWVRLRRCTLNARRCLAAINRQHARCAISRWLGWYQRRARGYRTCAILQRRSVKCFLLQKFNHWKTAVKQLASQRMKSYHILDHRTTEITRGRTFSKWLDWLKRCRRYRRLSRSYFRLQYFIQMQTLRNYLCRWRLCVRALVRRRRALSWMERRNINDFTRIIFSRWVRLVSDRRHFRSIAHATEPLQAQIESLARQLHLAQQQLASLIENQTPEMDSEIFRATVLTEVTRREAAAAEGERVRKLLNPRSIVMDEDMVGAVVRRELERILSDTSSSVSSVLPAQPSPYADPLAGFAPHLLQQYGSPHGPGGLYNPPLRHYGGIMAPSDSQQGIATSPSSGESSNPRSNSVADYVRHANNAAAQGPATCQVPSQAAAQGSITRQAPGRTVNTLLLPKEEGNATSAERIRQYPLNAKMVKSVSSSFLDFSEASKPLDYI